jgi:hypothetical protein
MRWSFAPSLRNQADINQLRRPPQAGAPHTLGQPPPLDKNHPATTKLRVLFRIEHPGSHFVF